MTTPTYRSINQRATLLGIDRRLCIVILIVAFLVFRHFTVSSHKSLLDGIDRRRVPERCKPPYGDDSQLFVTELFLNTSSPAYPTA